ncbi:MAG: TatD family hydrolase [Bacteroidota bacterium]
MMMLIDTHAHLYLPKFDDDRDEVMERARQNGIEKIYLPNIDHQSIPSMLKMEETYPDRCFAMMGLHPCSVKENYQEELKIVETWLGKRDFCAVGEIGIDLYWDTSFVEQQKAAFRRQINWAKDLGRPIVIHSRASTDMTIDLIREEQDGRLAGIFHCFGGTVEQAKAITDLGFYLGIGGVLTFKKAGLDKTMAEVSLEHVVLETDAPYLAPTPFRGKRNESAYIHQIASRLASIKETSLEALAKITSANAQRIFAA